MAGRHSLGGGGAAARRTPASAPAAARAGGSGGGSGGSARRKSFVPRVASVTRSRTSGGSGGGGAAGALPQYRNRAELQRDVDSVVAALGESQSWDRQAKALDRLGAILRAVEDNASLVAVLGVPAVLRALTPPLRSPRSALVRKATAVAVGLARRLAHDLRWSKREAPELFDILRQTLGSRTKLISECAQKALVALVRALPAVASVPSILRMCGADARDPRVRRVGTDLLANELEQLENDDAETLENDLTAIEEAIAVSLTDADPEVIDLFLFYYLSFFRFPFFKTRIAKTHCKTNKKTTGSSKCAPLLCGVWRDIFGSRRYAGRSPGSRSSSICGTRRCGNASENAVGSNGAVSDKQHWQRVWQWQFCGQQCVIA